MQHSIALALIEYGRCGTAAELSADSYYHAFVTRERSMAVKLRQDCPRDIVVMVIENILNGKRDVQYVGEVVERPVAPEKNHWRVFWTPALFSFLRNRSPKVHREPCP